jgi:hypothetical protein
MSKKFSVAMIVAGLAALGGSGMAMANPTLTITTPNQTVSTPYQVNLFTDVGFSVGDLSGTTTGLSTYGNASSPNEITFASIALTNNSKTQTETFSIDITDPGFTANGTLNNELYTAIETFGGEVSNGTSDMTFTTTASTPANASVATIVQTQNITGGTNGTPFGTPQGTSRPTLVLSPGQAFTIDSNFAFTLTPGATVSVGLGQLNDNGFSEVIPTGQVTPEPTSAAIAMGGMLPLFFLKRRRTS